MAELTTQSVNPGTAGTRARSTWSPAVVAALLRASDVAVVVLTAIAAIYIRFGEWDGRYIEAIALTALVAFNVFHLRRLYRLDEVRSGYRQFRNVAVGWTFTMLGIVLLAFVTKTSEDYSRLWAGIWFALGFIGLFASRAVWRGVVARATARGYLAQPVFVAGTAAAVGDVIARLRESGDGDCDVRGVFVDGSPGELARAHGIPHAGSLEELPEQVRGSGVGRVVLALPWDRAESIRSLLQSLRGISADVELALPRVAGGLEAETLHWLGGVPALGLMRRPMSEAALLVKKLEDYGLASILLLLLAPVMAAVALAVKLDSRGPALFRQPRYGFNNELFQVYKFRTMRREDCDARADALARRDDPRVTRVGRLLRRTSLDELPQLLNVLKGDMSIVGPRPHAVAAKAGGRLYEDVVADYAARHRVRPGITGWAQVNGWRGETDTVEKLERRVEHDLEYITNWSLGWDIWIIVRTIFVTALGRNAH